MKNSKKFARKVLAMLIAVIMAASSFTGVLTVYAKSTDDNHDAQLAANFMAWAETTDNQTAEALLDWADATLAKANIAPIIFHGNYVVVNINIEGYIDSIDGVLDLVRQANGLLGQYGGLLGGDIANVDLSPIASLPSITKGEGIVSKCSRSYRAVNDAKTIVMALAKNIYWLSNDNTASGHTNKNVIGQFIKGNLSLGSILNGVLDVYGLIGGMLNMWDGYQSNLVYNILGQLILTMTDWYTEAEIADYQNYLKGNGGTKWNFDTQLFAKLTDAFMNKISVTMTYALEKQVAEDGTVTYEKTDSSKARYEKIKHWLNANGLAETDANVRAAVNALNSANGTNWDPNLRYDLGDGMIYIFQYWNGSSYDGLTITPNTKVFDLVNDALALAWKTVLKPTLRTMRVNNSMDWYEDHGGNFDNQYYYWLLENGLVDLQNWENNYTTEKFNAYAEAVMKNYGCDDVEQFTAKVKKTFDYDRSVVEDPTYTWKDVEKACNYTTEAGRRESILFGKLRYSPLADKVFNMQTGPINLYIMQTGFANFEAFMDDYISTNTQGYANLVEAANDAIVAFAKDVFPDSANIGLGDGKNNVTTNLVRPNMATTGKSKTALQIADVFISNVTKMFEYAANATDENLLNIYYHNHNITDKTTSNHLTEANFEEAMIPTATACIRLIAMTRTIHDEDWDYALDAEGLGFVALREYLSYSLPQKDYDSLVEVRDGKWSAKVDTNGDGKLDLYLDVLLPMARDAVGYLLNSVVPCRDKNGNVWDVYKSNPATDKTELFDILNSVVCYYASDEEFNEPSWNKTATKTYGKAVASLLGVVGNDGKCAVKMSNTIWQNIDVIVNKVLPTAGVLQYGLSSKASEFNSEELIYTRFVKSLLNISDVQPSTGKMGVTSLIAQLLTIFTAEPIMNKGIDKLVYDDVVAALINGIFGKRTTAQTYSKIIPTSADMNSNTPFDSLVQRGVFALYKGDGEKENGVLGNLLSNIYGDFGGDAECGSTFATNSGNGCWQGAMFAVKAVSYFIDGFIPELNDHKFKAASISVNDPSRSNIASGSEMDPTTLTLKNEAVGLNRFYKDANGNLVADDRYFVEVVDLVYEAQGGDVNFTIDNVNGSMIAPEKAIRLTVDGLNPDDTSLVKFSLTYNVYLGTQNNQKKTPLYQNQVATCYLYLSSEGGWAGAALDQIDSKGGRYPSSEDNYNEVEYDEDGNIVQVYKNLVIANNNVSQINDFAIYQTGLDGLFAADDAGNAYVAFDADNGDIQNIDRFDYKYAGIDWQRGEEVNINGVTAYKGFTRDEANAAVDGHNDIQIRTHIALTQEEAGSVVKTTEMSAAGKYTAVTVDPQLVKEGCATAATPTAGINFADFRGTESETPRWLKHEDSSISGSVSADTYVMNLCGYNEAGIHSLDTVNVIIANTSGADHLQQVYEGYLQEMSPYQPTDFKDYNEGYGSSDTNDNLQRKFQDTVRAISAPVTLESARELVSVEETVAQTSRTTSATGDTAYKPATSVTGKLADSVYKKGNFYYIDEACTIPVYAHAELTDADVTNGKDATGQAVDKQGEYYYLVNGYSYEYEWDATTYSYPYYKQTDRVAQYNDGTEEEPVMKNYYEQVQYVYFKENGAQVSSGDDWAYKYAITTNRTKQNEGRNDYRGYYAKLEDALNYYVAEAKKNVDTSLITMVTEDIIADRAGKNSVNYDVATYEKMVQIAKQGEALVSDTGKKDADGKTIYTTNASSVEIKEANRLYEKYKALVISRGYEGNKLEAEIKHLTGVSKASIVATVDEDEETGVKTATVKFNGTPAYGKIVNGTLVNEGATVYSSETWDAYVVALAEAVITAQEAKEENISGTYSAKKNVVYAENNLAEPEAETDFVLSGTVAVATDGKGTAGATAVAGAKFYVDNQLVATANAEGAYSLTLPLGVETTVTVKAAHGIDRTFTITSEGDVEKNIGIVVYDYNADGKINAVDAALMAKAKAAVDKNAFKDMLRNGVDYEAL